MGDDMSEKDKATSGADAATSGQGEQVDKKDSVSYDTYQKVLAEKKAKDAKLAELSAWKQQQEQKDMEVQGKSSELIAALRAQVEEKDKALKQTRQAYGEKVVFESIKAEAAKVGCVKPDALIKLADWSTVEVKDDFSVNQDDLSRVILQAQKEHDYLFKKQVNAPKDGHPSTGSGQFASKSIDKMTSSELVEYAKSKFQ